jgi:hypothetical protein
MNSVSTAFSQLMEAIKKGDLAKVSELVSTGLDINQMDKYGKNPLIKAAQYGHVDIVQYFFDKGVNLNDQSAKKWTALMYAAKYGHIDVVKYLVDHGADVNISDDEHNTALSLSISKGHDLVEDFLLQLPQIVVPPVFRYKDWVMDEIEDLVYQRYTQRLESLENQNLSPDEYDREKLKLEDAATIELNLVDYTFPEDFFYDFFHDFHEECSNFKADLTIEDIDDMFINAIMSLFKAKLEIYDSLSKTDVRQKAAFVAMVPHEKNQRIIWTEAQDKLSEALRKDFDEAFKPLLDHQEKLKINLYTKHGSIQADEQTMVDQHAPSAIIENLSRYYSYFLERDVSDKSSEMYPVDYGLNILKWNALSAQYALNANEKDIDVYLPDGEIITSSIFWNYELNALRKWELEADKTKGNIIYHRLLTPVKSQVNRIMENIKSLQIEIDNIREEISQYSPHSSKADLLSNNKKILKERIGELEKRKYELCASNTNWVVVPFEQLTLKGLQVHDKSMTVASLIKVSDLLKQQLAKKQNAKIDVADKVDLPLEPPKNYIPTYAGSSSKSVPTLDKLSEKGPEKEQAKESITDYKKASKK